MWDRGVLQALSAGRRTLQPARSCCVMRIDMGAWRSRLKRLWWLLSSFSCSFGLSGLLGSGPVASCSSNNACAASFFSADSTPFCPMLCSQQYEKVCLRPRVLQ